MVEPVSCTVGDYRGGLTISGETLDSRARTRARIPEYLRTAAIGSFAIAFTTAPNRLLRHGGPLVLQGLIAFAHVLASSPISSRLSLVILVSSFRASPSACSTSSSLAWMACVSDAPLAE